MAAAGGIVLYVSGASGDLAVKKNQERAELILKNAGVEFTKQEITLVEAGAKAALLQKANRAKCPLVFVNGEYKAFEELDEANENGEVKQFLGV
jgi:precorrin-6B methylase 2